MVRKLWLLWRDARIENDPLVRSERAIQRAVTEAMLMSLVEREGVKSCAILILRTSDPDQVQGIAFVNFRRPTSFPPEERTAMVAFASGAAIAIRTARTNTATNRLLRQRDLELQSIEDIEALIGRCRPKAERHPQDPDLDSVLNRVMSAAKELTGANSAWIANGRSSSWVCPVRAPR